MKWFADRLGWSWPTSYVEVLSRHDGVLVQDANVYGFLESIDHFVNILHGSWHRPNGYWPVGNDGCGNYYALFMAQPPRSDDSPVMFFEMIESQEQPSRTVAANYPEFVTQQMRAQCRDAGCTYLF